ncbi:hypothetical protein F5880DRAFT_1619232 [Lentinula raphanica]|nr:hypothetical protein F5880DRAFT_1619232 [Lentinula raphanica]
MKVMLVIEIYLALAPGSDSSPLITYSHVINALSLSSMRVISEEHQDFFSITVAAVLLLLASAPLPDSLRLATEDSTSFLATSQRLPSSQFCVDQLPGYRELGSISSAILESAVLFSLPLIEVDRCRFVLIISNAVVALQYSLSSQELPQNLYFEQSLMRCQSEMTDLPSGVPDHLASSSSLTPTLAQPPPPAASHAPFHATSHAPYATSYAPSHPRSMAPSRAGSRTSSRAPSRAPYHIPTRTPSDVLTPPPPPPLLPGVLSGAQPLVSSSALLRGH